MNTHFFVNTYCAEGGYYSVLTCILLVHVLWRCRFRECLPWVMFILFLGMRIARDTIIVILLLSSKLSDHQNALYLKTIGILDITAFGVLFITTHMLVMLAAPAATGRTSDGNADSESNRLGPHRLVVAILAVLLTLGMVLGGIGQSRVMLQDGLLTNSGHSLTKAGLVFYTIAYLDIAIIHVFLGVFSRLHLSRKVFVKMSVALVLLLVRLIYRWLNEVGGEKWSPLHGTWGYYLALGGIMEWIITGLYVILAFITRPPPLAAPEIYYIPQLNAIDRGKSGFGPEEDYDLKM